jgi:hypothetical protein
MTPEQVRAELERERLIAECHSLIAAIASKPGSIKLLRGGVLSLRLYAAKKLI